jgi:hypothetical protein
VGGLTFINAGGMINTGVMRDANSVSYNDGVLKWQVVPEIHTLEQTILVHGLVQGFVH